MQLTTNPGSDSPPSWSPDGSSITYVTVIEPELIWYAVNKLAVIPSTGGEPELLTAKLDRNVSSPRFSPDGRSVYFLLEDSGERHLATIEVRSNKLTRPVAGEQNVRSFHMNKSGITAVLISQLHIRGEIFITERDGTRQLSKANDDFLSGIDLAEVENAHFKSKDGTEIEGFICKPVGYNASFQYPTLLRIHGGPV